jgi:hypothetical protein
VGMTPVSKVETPLPRFTLGTIAMEHASRVLAEVETEAERVLGLGSMIPLLPWTFQMVVG